MTYRTEKELNAAILRHLKRGKHFEEMAKAAFKESSPAKGQMYTNEAEKQGYLRKIAELDLDSKLVMTDAGYEGY